MKTKLFLILLAVIIIGVYSQNKTEISIPTSSIRLRVIPHSNTPQDINIKEQVKNYLQTDLYTLLQYTNNIDTARTIINNNLPTIKENIQNIFNNNNYNLPYEVNFGYNYFPEKEYYGKTYEEGEYESLVVYIGDSKGDNWWCVLFPNLCLIEKTEDIKYKSYIKELLTKIF